ncbi:CapA family protein [Paenibacillus lentus]|uniref:CapA family protein n=1 Tax=Paenibacillus lentus TaxID=1338368 RepID=A0A3Q8SF15_9BACL|nr:CapA family protein [Paenibacillus lentus]AZK49138.1 CapA family protein [Paenibacillus lentus]
MYPPRSEKYRTKKQEKQRRQSRFWLTLNVSLIIAIIALGAYYFVEERTSPGSGRSEEPASVEYSLNHTSEDPAEGRDISKADEGSPPSAHEQDGHPAADEIDEGMEIESPDDEEAPPLFEDQEDGETVQLHFAGDTIFSGSVASMLEKEGYQYPYEHVRDLFISDDLSVLNLETPVTDRGTPAEDKSFVFKASPKVLPSMLLAGVDAVNLANNHTLDQGIEGLLDTIKHLKDSKIHYFGAGKNKQDAYAPVYLERKGIKMALFGFSRVIPHADWAAGKNKPGLAVAYDPKEAVKAIQGARENADLVIVVTHWGKERATVLEKHQTSLAHSFVDAGADLIIGGHPHVLQGLERYKGKWIAYSTGNFIFTKNPTAPDTLETAVFEAKCTKQGDCQMKLHPFRTDIGQPVPLKDEEGAQLLKKVESLSNNISIDSLGNVHSLIKE